LENVEVPVTKEDKNTYPSLDVDDICIGEVYFDVICISSDDMIHDIGVCSDNDMNRDIDVVKCDAIIQNELLLKPYDIDLPLCFYFGCDVIEFDRWYGDVFQSDDIEKYVDVANIPQVVVDYVDEVDNLIKV